MVNKFLLAFFGVVGIYFAAKILIAISPALFICILIAGAIVYFTNWCEWLMDAVCEWFDGLV